MGTIAEKLEYLNTTKTQLREAINNKGGSLTTSSPFRDYVDAVSAIPMTEQHTDYAGSYTVTENGTLPTAGKAMTENVVVNVPMQGALEKAWNTWKTSTAHSTNWTNAFQCDSYSTPVIKSIADVSTLDFSGSEKVTNMRGMFQNCTYLRSIPFFNTSKVENMSYMFENCTSIRTLPTFDTSSATNMSYMFSKCNILTDVPLFNTLNVTDMSYMFVDCVSLRSVPLFNTLSVTNMGSMFLRCSNLTSVPAFDTSNVTNMSYMFSRCSNLTSIPAFDTSNVTNMTYMFQSCSNLETVHMHGMKVSFGISASTQFTREALIEVINNCADLTGGDAQKLTMGSTNLAKLTEEDIAIATNKNWTLA